MCGMYVFNLILLILCVVLRNFYVIAKGTIRSCLIIANHVYFLTYLTWIVILYPLKILGYNDVFNKVEGQMMLGLIKMITMWNEWAGYEVLEAGDDITPCLDERTLVLVNHQAPGDVVMLFSAFIGWDKIIPNTMWIMDHFIKYSTAGVVSSIRRDFFIHQGKAKRLESLAALGEHIRNYYIPLKRKWLVLFPEGGFLSKRRKNSQKYGELNNLPHLEHVTIPRTGALKVIMNELNPENSDVSLSHTHDTNKLKFILDIIIAYPNGQPLGFSNIVFGNHPPCKTVVCYRLYSIEEIPPGEEGLSEWLLSRWVEKEEILKEFYDTGEFPLKPNAQIPKPVKQNFLTYCFLHVMFILATVIPYNLLMSVYQNCFTL